MKTLICVLMLLAAQAFPQGTVVFQNNGLTPLMTNDLQGNIGLTSGVDAYRIGLYIAPAGTIDPQSFSLIGLATNISVSAFPQFYGTFNGGSLFVISNNSGQEIAFQVRAWSLFAGLSHEDALLYPGPETVYAGSSTIGYTTPGTGSVPPANLFGTLVGIGVVGGFTLTPIIPEPSTVALAMVGAGVLWFATRARRKSSQR